MSAREELLNAIAGLRRRATLLAAGAGLGWAVAAAVLAMIACVWGDLALELPAGMRAGAWIAAVTLALIVLLRIAVAGRMRASARSIAARLDEVAIGGGQILSGVDLACVAPVSGSPDSLTEGLAAIAVTRARELAGKVAEAEALPMRPLLMPAVMLGVLALSLIGAAVFAPRMTSTEWRRMIDPYGDHPPYSRILLEVTPGDTIVVYGQGLEIRASATGSPEHVELVLSGQAGETERLPMFQESPGKWRAALTQVTAAQQYHVRADTARSRRFSIRVVTVPHIEAARFRVTPPAYTRRAAYEGPLPQGGLAGLRRTRVEIWTRSNRPLSGGSIRFVPKTGTTSAPSTQPAVSMLPAGDGQEVTGTVSISSAGQFEIRVTDRDGQISQDTFVAPVTALADERPFVRLLEPGAESLATPTASVPVVMAGEDDYGVSRLQLYRNLNECRPRPMSIAADKTPTRVVETVQLPLADYGLRPGDTIKLFARVEDNDPDGVKGSESGISVLHIVSQEEYERLLRVRQGLEVLMAKYQQAERRLEALQAEIDRLEQELAQTPAGAELTPHQQELLKKLLGQVAEDAAEIQKSTKVDLPYDVDKKLTAELQKLARSLEVAEKEAAASQPSTPAEARRTLQTLRKKLGENRREYNASAMQPLEHLAAIYPLLEDQARFVVLYQRQRALAERAAALNGHDREDNPSLKNRMRDLEAEQRDIRQALRDLLDDIDAHAATLPADKRLDTLRNMARQFVKDVRASGAAGVISDAESALAEFLGTIGYRRSKEAADILEKFISRCQGTQGEGQMCLKFQPGLSSCLGNTVEQLLADAGLGQPGSAMGMGAGSGYSVQRSSLRNMGLYGAMPALGNPAITGSGSATPGRATRAGHASGHRDSPGESTPAAGRLHGAVAGEADVPIQYRQKVGRYFERLADELEQ
jgi:hypothetical protein